LDLEHKVLEMNDNTLHEAIQGDDALLLCGEHGSGIDLLLTDVVMPVMSGPELAERAVALRPEMKVLYMSGYTDDAMIRKDAHNIAIDFLPKPFTPMILTQTVRDALGKS